MKKILLTFCLVFVTYYAHAVLVPTLTLSLLNVDQVQLAVTGADANASVILNYLTNNGYKTLTVGTTNASGNLSVPVLSSTNGIPSGTQAFVTVDGAQSQFMTWPTYSSNGVLNLSQTNLTLTVGSSANINSANGNNILLSSNTHPEIAYSNISGSTITITASAIGNTDLTFCSSGIGCAKVTVYVQASSNNSTQTITFSQSNINLNVGQNQTVSISGASTGSYFVQTNSGSNAVTANINGNTVNLIGYAFGGANITICQVGGACGNIYVYVAPSGTTVSSVAPALASFGVSSSNTDNTFLGKGNVLTLSFSANQSINMPSIKINGKDMTSSGTGSGPYVATYTMTGSETLPLVISISFANASGNSTSATFSVGGVLSSSVSYSNTNVASAIQAISSAKFSRYLGVGDEGKDVTELQTLMKKLGVYSGPITGKYGQLTMNAVKKYQALRGISQKGVVGPSTLSALNKE